MLPVHQLPVLRSKNSSLLVTSFLEKGGYKAWVVCEQSWIAFIQ